MKQIKFRAWDKGKRLLFGESDGFVHTGRFCIRLDGRIYDTNLPEKEWSHDEIILQQFTGLLDKNGKEIYEGDIVEYHHFNSDKKMIEKVIFIDGKFTTEPSGCECINPIIENNVEVIGNIYENPELVK